MNINELKYICRFHRVHLSKARGQNFLIDENLLPILANLTVIDSNTSVIEIGAGLGNWTEHLARRARKVYAIEVDKKLGSILEQRTMDHRNVKPIITDVLKFNFQKLRSCMILIKKTFQKVFVFN